MIYYFIYSLFDLEFQYDSRTQGLNLKEGSVVLIRCLTSG